MINNEKVTGIVLSAGNSVRYGKNINKNFELVNEKEILYYSLKSFEENQYVDDIIIAARECDIENIKKLIKKENFAKNIKIVIGGNTRKESVFNCINSTDSQIVIIHDGARPVIKQYYINKCIECMNDYKGATIGVKSKDTIKIADENGVIIETTKRANTWVIQTPQCFNRLILLDTHRKYDSDEITDDCMLLEMENYKVKIIEGEYTNIKITTKEDLDVITSFLKKE